MTTTVKLAYVNGNKALAVLLDGRSVGELGPGRSIEVSIHSNQQLTVDETGEFFKTPQAEAPIPNADAFEGRKDLPPGAGNEGASVPDERV